MQTRVGFFVCGLLAIATTMALSAPARKIYYKSGNLDIRSCDPDGSNDAHILTSPGNWIGHIEVDTNSGHIYWEAQDSIYRAGLDGLGITSIVPEVDGNLWSFSLDLVNGHLYYGVDRRRLVRVNLDGSDPLILYAPTSAQSRNVLNPRVFADPGGRVLSWISDEIGLYRLPFGSSVVELIGVVPGEGAFGDVEEIGSTLAFPGGVPKIYSIVLLDDGLGSGKLAVSNLDGSELHGVDLPGLGDERMTLRVDLDGGDVYFGGRLSVGGEFQAGLFKFTLAGEMRAVIQSAARGVDAFAIDTAEIADSEPPQLTIFSPIGGVTNNQRTSIIGSVQDDSAIPSISWLHDGVGQGAVELFGGDFTVSGVVLHPGDNLLQVRAEDVAGNVGTAETTVTWQPLRSVMTSSPAQVREGHRISVDTTLESSGDVAGMTFTMSYDAEQFMSPVVTPGPVLQGMTVTINTLVDGEVSVSFAGAGSTVPAGLQTLVSTSLRARSVPAEISSTFGVEVADMSGANGSPIVVGTYQAGSEVTVRPRAIIGDSNSNDRLDIGDASVMQGMLAGLLSVREWDHLINDINGSLTLDSGDVIRTLRTVVGIDPQPQLLLAAKGGHRSVARGGSVPGPRIRLMPDKDYASPGETLVIKVEVDRLDGPFSGAAFVVDYPADALRLENATSHRPGAIVAGDAFLLWNVAPAQNDYTNQSGSISFGASSSSAWPNSSAGGTLAELHFTVQSGATTQPVWPITVRAAELSTEGGFEIVPLAGEMTPFIGSPLRYADWVAANFTAQQVSDPSISAWTADPDKDGTPNGGEYFAGTGPFDTGAGLIESVGVNGDDANGRCVLLTITRDLRAVDAECVVEFSPDMEMWGALFGGSPAVGLWDSQISIGSATEILTYTSLVPQPVQFLRATFPPPAVD